jgi:SnoaL-like domain
MQKLTGPLIVAGAILGGAIIGTTFSGIAAGNSSSYAEDRAEIQNLQARYLFAMDWGDADAYASTFAPDGVLDFAGGVEKGRQQIHDAIKKFHDDDMKRSAAAASGLRPAHRRHNISNIVVKIDGNHATGRAYWFEFHDDNPERKAYVGAYGHYEDELEKIDGKWYFTKRKIMNEQMASRAAEPANPAW